MRRVPEVGTLSKGMRHKGRLRGVAKLQQNPLCEICLQKGKIEPAIDVHHIDSFTQYQGLKLLEKAYNYSNLLSVCKQCHQQLHNSH